MEIFVNFHMVNGDTFSTVVELGENETAKDVLNLLFDDIARTSSESTKPMFVFSDLILVGEINAVTIDEVESDEAPTT